MPYRRAGIAVFLACLVVLAACWPWGRVEPIRIGLVGSWSGRFASLGVTGRDGALLAMDDINAAGGIDGHPIELIVRDDASDAATCRAVFAELAAAGCRVVVGPFATGPATAILDDINRVPMLALAPTVAGDNFTGLDDWFLRLYPSTRQMGRLLGAMHLADGGGALAVIGDESNGPFVSTTLAGLAEAGVTVRHIAFDGRGNPPLADIAAGVGTEPAVLLVASSLDTAVLAQRLRQQGQPRRLLCASWAVSPELVANGGAAIDGVRTVLPVDLGIDPGLAKRYQDHVGGDLTHVALLYHEAVHLMASAIRAAGGFDPVALRGALTDGRALPGFPAAMLDRTGDPLRPLVPHRYVNGRLVAEVQP